MPISINTLNEEHGSNGTNGTNGTNGLAAQPSINGQNGSTTPDHQIKSSVVETEFLVVGAGPAGAALACFLTSYGMLCY